MTIATNKATTSTTTSTSTSTSTTVSDSYDLVIIGGGVVGCAVLRAATLQGWKCALIEAEPHLLSHASGSNSGIVCTGVDATPGTLERALIRDSNSLFRIYCKDHNIPIRPCGSLVCSWSWDDEHDEHDEHGNDDDDDEITTMKKKKSKINKLQNVYNESYEANDIHVQKLSSKQISILEPNISHKDIRGGGNDSDGDDNGNIDDYDYGGVHIKGEIVIDPWLYSISLAIHAKENGATIYTNWTYDSLESNFDNDNECWNVVIYQQNDCTTRRNDNESISGSSSSSSSSNSSSSNNEEQHTIKKILHAKAVVNAAGLWSDTIQQQSLQTNTTTKSKTHFTTTNRHTKSTSTSTSTSKPTTSKPMTKNTWNAKPRRGQYRIYTSNKSTTITHPIQPIPTQRTKGIFVFSSIYDQIVVGPTALDQISKTDKSIDSNVRRMLDQYLKRIIPSITIPNDDDYHYHYDQNNSDDGGDHHHHYGGDCIGEYVGIRPGTDKRDYQIYLRPKLNWMDVAGIRSTGLTASLGIGNYVVRNLKVIFDSCDTFLTTTTTTTECFRNTTTTDIDSSIDLETDADIDAGAHTDITSPLLSSCITTPLPPLNTLIKDFQRRNDSFVEIHGHLYKVTHPLTKLGWSAYSVIQSP